MSFQYSIDDVRLVGVRLGGFVNRDDWGGRGGSPLRPLGKMIHAPKDPARPAQWRRSGGDSLKASLRSTTTAGGVAALSYELINSKGEVLASCEERPRMLSTTHGSGYARAFVVTAKESALVTAYPFSGPTSQSWTLNGGEGGDTGSLSTGRVRCNRPLSNPGNELRMLSYAPGVLHAEQGVELSLHAGETLNFEVGVVFLTDWSDENAMHVLKGVSRGDV
jgi:hypothetical protein